MENVLPVVLVGQVDVVQQQREVDQEPLGQVKVDSGTLREKFILKGLEKKGIFGEIFPLFTCRKQTWKTVSPTQPLFSTSQQCWV